MRTADSPSLSGTTRNTNPLDLWYAPDRRIRTQAASALAKAHVEKIRANRGESGLLDEQQLFIALHTCAYRAARPARTRRVTAAERNLWAQRWDIVRGYIVEQNLGLVYSMIGRFAARHLDEDDRLSEAMYALTRAVDRFNPWRGYKFSTYACNVIARALMRRGKQEGNHRRLFPVQHDLTFERPSRLPDSNAELYVERLQRALNGNLGDLTELETRILTHRFPKEQGSRMTFQEIGDTIGLSKERVRQIQNIALHKLREVLHSDPVLG